MFNLFMYTVGLACLTLGIYGLGWGGLDPLPGIGVILIGMGTIFRHGGEILLKMKKSIVTEP